MFVITQTNIKHTVNTSCHYQLPVQYSMSLLSSISSPGLFHPKSMDILSISSMFLNEKTDFLLIEFFNLNFRFPLGSSNAKFIISGFSFVTS